MFGYHGRFLRVDLSSGEIGDLPISEQQARDFIGGAGLSARLIYDHVRSDIDPLGPENPLVFAVGPFVNIDSNGEPELNLRNLAADRFLGRSHYRWRLPGPVEGLGL